MKSTIRISGVPMGANGELEPVIKIVQPCEITKGYHYETPTDEDIKDDLLNMFLRTPSRVEGNYWFEIKTSNDIPFMSDNPTHRITTIGPVYIEQLFYRFRHAILNRMVPYDAIVELNGIGMEGDGFKHIKSGKRPMPERGDVYLKIHEFFDWIDEIGWIEWEKQQPSNTVNK